MTWVPLKRVADVWPSNVDKLAVEGEHPVRLVNYTDVYYGDRLHPGLDLMPATATTDEIAKFRLQRGDVILTKDSESADDIGISAYVDEVSPDMVCGYHLSLVRPTAAVGRYLHYAISSAHARRQMSVAATGVTRFGLRSESVGSLSVWNPPLTEQRAIADYLDAETARIDALIAKKQQLIRALEARLKAGVRSLVTGGSKLGPKWEPGAPWVGPVPTGWRPMKIAWHKRTGSGTTPRSDHVGMYEGGSTPWVTTAELRETRIDSTMKCVTGDALTEYSALRIFPVGTLLVAMYGATVGRLGVLGVPATTNQACCAIHGEGVLHQEFLYWWLRAFRNDLVDLAHGAGQPNISQDAIRSLRVPAPSREEQKEIARSCAELAERLDATGRVLARQLELLAEHRQALITAAVTGEFAVPGAA